MTEEEALYRDWTFTRDALRKITRNWFHDLSHLEVRIVLFIYDRTLGWGKKWERVTRRHLAEGVWGEDGECYGSPVTFNNAGRGVEALNELVRRGVILKRPDRNRFEYALNLSWEPEMKIPKRLQKEVTSDPPREVTSDLLKGVTSDPPKSNKRKRPQRGRREEMLRDGAAGPPAGESSPLSEMENAVECVRRRSRKRKKVKSKEGKFARSCKDRSGFVPTRSALGAKWSLLYREHYPDAGMSPVPHLTLTLFHQYATAWTKARESGEFLDYLEWLFKNWNVMGATILDWMTDYPETPSMRMLVTVKLRDLFEEAYRKRERLSRWSKLPGWKRIREDLIHAGWDKDEAEREAKRRVGFEDEKKALAKEREKLRLLIERSRYTLGTNDSKKKKKKAERKPREQPEGDFGKWRDKDD